MGAGLIAEWLEIASSDAPAFFSGAFQLSNGGNGNIGGLNVFVEPSLQGDTFIVGNKQAVRFHEQTPPIAVQALNIANGGIDLGVFGYSMTYVWVPNALVKGTVA
jgi:hypothetical protein